MVGTARDLEKARRALAAALATGASVELVEADLASLSSVRKAADEIARARKPFDVIIANAGVMACPQGKTAGWLRNAIRNQSPWAFRVRQSAGAAAEVGRTNRHALLGWSSDQRRQHRRSEFRAHRIPAVLRYGRSKTANILYAVALDNRLKGRGVRATSLHPGGIQTELGRHMTPELRRADAGAHQPRSKGGCRRSGSRLFRKVRRLRYGRASSHRRTRSAAAIARTATYAR